MKENEFLNPYNFIELPEHKRKQYEDMDRHTGVIEYSVTTKTPLFIPNTSSNKAFKISDEKEFSDPEKAHHSYDFYSYTLLKQNQRYDDVYHQPVIPGSEVRGMIRNLYETLTDSCMSGLTVNEIPNVSGILKEEPVNTIGKLAGEFAPCKNANQMCPSCALFGTIGEDIPSAAASKLRFADLLPEKMQENVKSYYDNIITLQTLGGPKLENVAFYLKKPYGANFWTYDYYTDKKDKVCRKPGTLRGRKYYWHHQNFNYTEGVEATNLNKTIRPVKSGITFKGKIFFEDISEKQLQELVWIVNGGNTDSTEKKDICYKLGAAKPLGLGSVKCSISRVLERAVCLQDDTIEYKEVNITDRYCSLSYEENGFSNTGRRVFLNMCNYHAVPDSIMLSYPREEEQMEDEILEEGYLWFQNNREKTDHKGLKIKQELPPATNVATLKCHRLETQNNKGRSSYGRR